MSAMPFKMSTRICPVVTFPLSPQVGSRSPAAATAGRAIQPTRTIASRVRNPTLSRTPRNRASFVWGVREAGRILLDWVRRVPRLCVLDLDLLDHHVRARTVLRTRRSLGDGLDHVHPLRDLPEDGVLPVQPRRGRHRDEELRPIGVRPRVGHGQQAGAVERWAARRTLVLELVAGASPARALRIAALDHEVGDDPVEDRAVVQRLGLRTAVAGIAPLALPPREL